MIFDALSNSAGRVSLHGHGAELDTPGPARSAPSSGPARVKVRQSFQKVSLESFEKDKF